MSSASHFSIFGRIYNEPALKGVKKAPFSLPKENRIYNPRYMYLTENKNKNNSNSDKEK